MLFKPYHIPMIRSGSKTATRREWSENYHGPNVGSVIAATEELFTSDDEADCFIRLTDRYRQPLGEMTDADARAEGDYDDLAEFREAYREVYGDDAWDDEKVVDVVEFEYVGRARDPEQDTLMTDGGEVSDDNEVAEYPEHMQSVLTKVALRGIVAQQRSVWERLADKWLPWRDDIDWNTLSQYSTELWENPEAFAEGEGSDPWKGRAEIMTFQLGVLFGIEYERAYPTGRRDEWPVPLDEREEPDQEDEAMRCPECDEEHSEWTDAGTAANSDGRTTLDLWECDRCGYTLEGVRL